MRRLTIAAIAAISTITASQIASAADLPRKAPAYAPLSPPAYSWTGFYVGLNAGGTWGSGDATNTMTPAFVDPGWPHGVNGPEHLVGISAATSGTVSNGSNNDGFIGGGQIGYNWQFNNWVAGIEADIQGIANKGNNSIFTGAAAVGPADPSNWFGAVSINKKLDYLGTLRGRLGFLATPSMLIFGTGGLAYGRVSTNTAVSVANDVYSPSGHIPPGTAFASASGTRAGWTLGGGLEWMFAPRWSVKAEYLYYDLGTLDSNYTMTVSDTASGLNANFAGHSSVDFKGHIARAGINYHF
jgi:outer membrane immunogenic protein